MRWSAEDVRNGSIELGAQSHVQLAPKLVVSQVSECRSACEVSIGSEDFCRQGQTNINRRSKVTAEGQFVIGVCHGIVAKHYPVIPAKFTDMANVCLLSGHHSLRGLAIGHIDVIYCARTDECLQFNAVVPKHLRQSSLEHLVGGSVAAKIDFTVDLILAARKISNLGNIESTPLIYSIFLVILYQNIEFELCKSGGLFLPSWRRFYGAIISPDIEFTQL
jgi:hypothetical protein